MLNIVRDKTPELFPIVGKAHECTNDSVPEGFNHRWKTTTTTVTEVMFTIYDRAMEKMTTLIQGANNKNIYKVNM